MTKELMFTSKRMKTELLCTEVCYGCNFKLFQRQFQERFETKVEHDACKHFILTVNLLA